jgi:hypothetical protein
MRRDIVDDELQSQGRGQVVGAPCATVFDRRQSGETTTTI